MLMGVPLPLSTDGGKYKSARAHKGRREGAEARSLTVFTFIYAARTNWGSLLFLSNLQHHTHTHI